MPINVADSPMARMRMVLQYKILASRKIKSTPKPFCIFPPGGQLRVQGDLLAAHALGVRNVFVIMGDPDRYRRILPRSYG